MKTLVILLMLMAAALFFTSCDTINSMSNEDAYRFGYNTGVLIRGGSSDEMLR